MQEQSPARLSKVQAARVIAGIAGDTRNIVIIQHGRQRMTKRRITRRQIELCIQKGTIASEPFMNSHGNWQVEMYRHAAGEELTCVVAIDWPTKLIVITTYARG